MNKVGDGPLSIFHDWPAERCRLLVRRSFEALPRGGRVMVHEILFNDNRTGPFAAAAFNINMLVMMTGEQYSGREIKGFLAEAGFELKECHRSVCTNRDTALQNKMRTR